MERHYDRQLGVVISERTQQIIAQLFGDGAVERQHKQRLGINVEALNAVQNVGHEDSCFSGTRSRNNPSVRAVMIRCFELFGCHQSGLS